MEINVATAVFQKPVFGSQNRKKSSPNSPENRPQKTDESWAFWFGDRRPWMAANSLRAVESMI